MKRIRTIAAGAAAVIAATATMFAGVGTAMADIRDYYPTVSNI